MSLWMIIQRKYWDIYYVSWMSNRPRNIVQWIKNKEKRCGGWKFKWLRFFIVTSLMVHQCVIARNQSHTHSMKKKTCPWFTGRNNLISIIRWHTCKEEARELMDMTKKTSCYTDSGLHDTPVRKVKISVSDICLLSRLVPVYLLVMKKLENLWHDKEDLLLHQLWIFKKL